MIRRTGDNSARNRAALAVFQQLAGPNRNHLAALRLFLRRIGQHNAAGGFFRGFFSFLLARRHGFVTPFIRSLLEIGAGLSWAFSFLLPNWESNTLPRIVRGLLAAWFDIGFLEMQRIFLA